MDLFTTSRMDPFINKLGHICKRCKRASFKLNRKRTFGRAEGVHVGRDLIRKVSGHEVQFLS